METAIIVAIIGAVVSIISLTYQKRLENQQQIRKFNLERMVPIYQEILESVSSQILAVLSKESLPPPKGFTEKVAITSSGNVMSKYLALSIMLRNGDGTTLQIISAYTELMLAIRQDLGFQDEKLPRETALLLGTTSFGHLLNDHGDLIETEREECIDLIDKIIS